MEPVHPHNHITVFKKEESGSGQPTFSQPIPHSNPGRKQSDILRPENKQKPKVGQLKS